MELNVNAGKGTELGVFAHVIKGGGRVGREEGEDEPSNTADHPGGGQDAKRVASIGSKTGSPNVIPRPGGF